MKNWKLLSSPFLLLLLFAFNPVKVFGQGTQITPDCVVLINVTLAAQTTVAIPASPTTGGVGDNRTSGCQTWTLQYQATGTGALTSVAFQAGQSSTTTVSFANWAGTVNTGINPNTSSTGATTVFSTGCVSAVACTVANSWVRVLITRGTFAGTINGVVYGYKDGTSGGGAAGSSCTVGVPCVVVGPTAAGSAPTTSPLLVSGQDGAPGSIRTIKTDANGQLIPANASSADADGISNTEATPTGAGGGILYPRVFARVFNGTTWDRLVGNTTGIGIANALLAGADAVSNTVSTPTTVGGTQLYLRILPSLFNGSTNDRQFTCPNRTNFSISAGTDVVIAAGVASTNVQLCQIIFNGATTADYTIRQGTGTTCGTNTADLASVGQITGGVFDFKSNDATVKTTVTARDMCLHASTSVTILGTAFYAQF